jgi:cellulose synthase/poly-beta-1,6-N-acetylglucosamine synthase-like glycosyltransferase
MTRHRNATRLSDGAGWVSPGWRMRQEPGKGRGVPRPVVSVLLPAFDASATLRVCLRSLARQTETGWQCVLVDDGSRDSTRTIAEEAAHRDPRIRVVATPHHGIVAALNTGLDLCEAPVVARMDADDVMHRERLARQLAALDTDPSLVAVGCQVRFFPRRGMTDGLRDYERWLSSIDSARRVREDAFVECPIGHPTLMVRRDALAAVRYRDVGWPEDYDLVLRLLAAGREIGVVPRRLVAWRDGPSRLTRTSPVYGQDRIVACKAAFLAGGFLAGRERYVLWGHGGTGRALRHALAAHGMRPTHVIELHPGRVGNRIDGAPVVRPETLASLPRGGLVASVAGAEARGEIRRFLATLGWEELHDYVVAA